jgi:hypothetical protein
MDNSHAGPKTRKIFMSKKVKNPAAVALGRLARGVPKTLTDEQRTFRAQQLAQARKKRHGKPKRVARRSNESR